MVYGNNGGEQTYGDEDLYAEEVGESSEAD